MANPYYTPSGNPGTNAAGASSPMRSEFSSLSAAFDKLPNFTGNPNQFVVVNASGTGLTLIAGLTFTMNAFAVGLVAQANVTLNWPAVSGTLALTSDITAATLALLPPGAIVMWGTASAPTGWLFCGGQAVSRTGANAALFAAYGTTYGIGDGSTTFNLPDLRQRVPVGGTMGFTNPARLSTSMSPNATGVGSTGGAETNTASTTVSGGTAGSLSVSLSGTTQGDNADVQVQAGSGILVANAGHAHALPGGGGSTSGALTVSASGTSSAFFTVPPMIMLNFIVKI